ncbi:MAG: hypothetical protein ACRDJT_07065 [Actinomycetota bacterium]
MSRAKALAMLVAAAMVGSLLLLPSSSAEKSQASAERRTRARNTTVVPVKGEYRNGNPKFDGEMTVRRFVKRNGNLKAVGRLDGTVFGRNGGEKGTVEGRKVTAPVRIRQASCDILRLVLGPLDLNLLGLRVQLNRVVLNITAEPGPGNLLGNLLCAVAGLLDRGGLLNVIRNILNAILEALRLP